MAKRPMWAEKLRRQLRRTFQMPPENQETTTTDLHPKRLALGPLIGSGSFSKVFAGAYDGAPVAIKRQKRDPQINDYIAREIAILRQLEHPRLLRFIGQVNQPDEVWIVTEYLKGGDVSKLLKKAAPVTWYQRVQIALDAAEALAYLHDHGFIHRDIKAANLLLDDDRRCKLCDFGFAREAQVDTSTKPRRRMSLCGTDAYMAPEIHFDEAYGEHADIFSLGVVIMELICLRHVGVDDFLPRTPAQQFRIDINEFRRVTPASCPVSFALLAEHCTSFEPSDRPHAGEVVEWLTELLADLGTDDDNNAECNPEVLDETEFSIAVRPAVDLDIDEPPAHAGALLKRAAHGLRRWRQRYVVIADSTLTYYTSQKIYDKLRGTDSFAPSPEHTLALADCKLKKKANRRFVLVQGSQRKEFQATSIIELQSWLAILDQAIAVATHAKHAPPPPPPSPLSLHDDVYSWLRQLHMEQYAGAFKAKGFTTLDFLRETGLADDDFNFLGIDNTAHQAVLSAAALRLQTSDN
ncbi:TKL/LISK/LISK-DD1 protein kinase [Saprolegnia diclina VS20]|uniref:TKL/LISK/LISK-DD1 protein kinase n=1 Tax=Saprolegnia diclina (strain VS20) TaxID=1156394 RepID=T0R3V2_SAPDV|nr:TKL/LISK/LISK-DD1 protein kinase [Saprolegnia diclina VS20]EQC41000.1 TKL/LISK/LISK-DD1 protein kinase [Saprolegnia diclina VS20]|eukprot:XP_008605844.1 TKL/LISK/LISK-DD1 protein kinase [Saprolegnia diclina VS20]